MGPQSARKPLSLRAFAKRLGVDESAVRKAIVRGRLVASVGRNAKRQPVILDAAKARQEWMDNASKVQRGPGSALLAEAQRTVAVERARGLKLANDQRLGRVIDLEKAQRQSFESARVIRDAILNLPARLAGELAAESDPARVHQRLDEELRLALDAVAKTLSLTA